MALLPADIPTGLVTGQFYFVSEDNIDADTDPQLTVVSGTVTFTCSVPVLRMPAKAATVIPLVFNAKFDANGRLVADTDPTDGLKLPATDSADISPLNYTWRVDFNLKNAATGYTIQVPSFSFSVPSGQTTDLTAVMPVDTSPGTITVQGPAGPAGDPATVTDASVATQVQSGAQTTAALNATYLSKSDSSKFISVLKASGDTTGATDIAAINAALAANRVTILFGGTFNINAPIIQPSNTTLILQEATVFLVSGSNCNVWRNANQNATGDTNISIKGIGRASFNGNASGQVRQSVAKTDGTGGTSMRDNVGIYPVHITGFRIEDVQLGPMNAYTLAMYGVVNGRVSRVRLECDSSTPNQDGIDVGVGCQDVIIENVTGISGDDALVIMAIQWWRSTSPDTVPPAYQVGTALALPVQDIVFRDCEIKAGINLIRLLNDATATITRVVASNLKNSGRVGSIIFGPNSYINSGHYPGAGSISQVRMDTIVGGSSFSNTGYAIDLSTPVANLNISNFEVGTYGPGYAYGWKSIIGNAGGAGPFAVSDVTVNGVHSASVGTTNVGDMVKFNTSTVTVTDMVVENVKLAEANSLTNNTGPISGLTLRNIKVGTIYGNAFKSADTGYISDVAIGALSGTTTTYGVSVGAKLGHNMPTLTSGDSVPAAIDGSRIRTDGTIDPNGGGDTSGGEWVANGTTWVRAYSRTDGWATDGLAAPLYPSWYYAPVSSGTTTMGVGDGIMRGGILIAGRTCTITEIGLEVTTAGSAGSVLRLGLYKIPPGGSAANAVLLVDAGTIDGTVVGYAGKTISQKVNAGDKLLLLAAAQGGAATSPVVRGISGVVPYFSSATALTVSQNSLVGVNATGITGALPATTSLGTTITVPRVLVKSA